MLAASFTVGSGFAKVPPLRIALVILALWALVVEPTFGVFERMEQHSAPVERDRGDDDRCAGLDQPIPPHEVAPVQWVNQHARAELIIPSLCRFDVMSGRADGSSIALLPLPPHLSMPYPPSVAPLRL